MCSILIWLFLASTVVCEYWEEEDDHWPTKQGDYWTEREELLQREKSLIMGASINLTENEEIVNGYLMEKKWNEFDQGFQNSKSFIPSQHIFDTLGLIEQSEVFQFIRSVPKGGLLHGHDTALASGDYLYNLTFSDNLHACVSGDKIHLKFLKEPSQDVDSDNNCTWLPIEEQRREVNDFDTRLRQQLTLIREDHRDRYADINIVWNYFSNIFITVDPLICFKPIFQDYFYQVLKELYEDNVFYIEFRSTLPTVYDLDDNLYDEFEVASIYKEVAEEFMFAYPDFLGVKLIYAPVRRVDQETMSHYVEVARGLKANFPTFLAGFDLVGQEDLGKPLTEFLGQLQEIREEMNVFFHAGETNWFGSSTDENLIDAVLLGSVRIGHGFALIKRPEVLKLIRERNIAIEICPISNQVLLLNEDMRNHPGNYLIANGFPVVISNDDPSFWGTKALSYDWYMAFMGMTSRQTDLRFLKQLAINSLEYSVYDDKPAAIDKWEQQWFTFINSFAKKIIQNKGRERILLSDLRY